MASTDSPPAEDPLPVVSSVADFWVNLQNEKYRDQELPLQFEFSVIHYDPIWNNLWVEQGGERGYLLSHANHLPFEDGQIVRASGAIIPSQGLDAQRARFEIIGRVQLPDDVILATDWDDLSKVNLRFATMEGYVENQYSLDADHVQFDLIQSGYRIAAIARINPHDAIPQLTDKFARMRGVFIVEPGQTDNGPAISMRVVGKDAIQLVPVTEIEGLQGEATTIADLQDADANRQLRIDAVVYSQEPGKTVYARDATGQIRIETQQLRPLPTGTRVTVLGQPTQKDMVWTLSRPIIIEQTDEASDPSLVTEILYQFRSIEQALRLDPEEADRRHKIEATGVITFVSPNKRFLYFQDATGGIEVRLLSVSSQPMVVGAAITVVGHTTMGPFAPQIEADTISVAGEVALPKPIKLSFQQALSGSFAGAMVEMSGILETMTIDNEWTTYLLSTPSGDLPVRTQTSASFDDIEIGSVLSVRGVLAVEATETGQLRSILLLAPKREMLHTVLPAVEDPYSIPISQIGDIGRFHFQQNEYQRVHIQGIVTYHNPRRNLFIDDGVDAIQAQSRSDLRLQPGDRVDFVGLPFRQGSRIILRNGVYRKLDSSHQPIPTAVDSATDIEPALHGHLVTLQGKLIEKSRIRSELTLLLQTGESVIEAHCDYKEFKSIAESLETGAQLAITGVCSIEGQMGDDKTRVLLRNANDVLILKSAPWWNVRRAIAVALVGQVALFAGIAWGVMLRRRVARQTQLIKQQLEREALLQAQHHEIVHNTSDFICTVDSDGRFLSFNKAGEQLTGYSVAEAQSLTVFDLLPSSDARDQLADALRATEAVGTRVIETQLRTKSGAIAWVEANWGFIAAENRKKTAFGVLHDITNRKTIEDSLKQARDAAEENTRNKSAFLATISHELRTPMNGVIGMTDLILGTDIGPEPRSYAETIRDSAASLLGLLNDILDFSKAEAGKLSLDPQPFEIAETVAQISTLLDTTAKAKGLDLRCHIAPDVPPSLLGDASRLRQVILNLLGNALKFTERGHVSLSVAADRKSETDVALRFEISDTGIGIAPDVQQRLFQPFTQADGSHSRRFGGTGLGLVISRQIIELMGGQIGLNSAPGVGSTFWFTIALPVASQAHGDATSREEPTPMRDWSEQRLRVLVAEDIPVNQRVTLLQLKKIGIDADLAENGHEVLDMVSQKRYDLVFMDLQMPHMDGFEATNRLRANPTTQDLYIVALTANALAGDRERCFESGMNDYVSKPTNQRKLSRAIERFVHQRVG